MAARGASTPPSLPQSPKSFNPKPPTGASTKRAATAFIILVSLALLLAAFLAAVVSLALVIAAFLSGGCASTTIYVDADNGAKVELTASTSRPVSMEGLNNAAVGDAAIGALAGGAAGSVVPGVGTAAGVAAGAATGAIVGNTAPAP